ncbi:zinc carboxypeptidase [Bisporella sp. PMI_857]|nr:zinc carboxypeptidase [Bisporella sp. PMI_857]
MKPSSALLLALNSAALVAAKVSYDGAKAMRIAVGEDVVPLLDVINELDLPTWKGLSNGVPVANGHVDLVVPADKVAEFEQLTANMATEVMHEDLGASIADEGREYVYIAGTANATWFNAYHAYADHLTFLNDLVALYPTQAEIVTAGASVNGRPITGIHFWGSGGKGSKPAIVLHSTVHAREWITTMTTEYFAYNLLTNYNTSTEIKGFVDKYDYYIFPVVNPDGFVYTQTTNRLWRKNRQTLSTSSCVGRDVNRNWPYQWSGSGSSTNPCDETYRGAAQGDAPENKGLVAQINALAADKGVQLYIDVHSYSQLFMTPYGYSCTARTPNNSILQTLASGAASAIRAVYGTTYQYGPVCQTIYQVAGGSIDYVQDVTKAKYVFTIELRDTGTNGFVLPASQIVPSGVETFAGFRHLLLNMT